MQQSLATTQQKVGALQTAQTTMQMSLATTIEAEVQRQIEQSNVVTQNLRGDLLAATEAFTQTLTAATTQTQEAVAHLKAAKLKYDKAAKALQDHMQRKTQQLASMEAQFKEWQKSANQLEAVKKKTGTLQQIQQGIIEANQRDLHETKSQVEVLVQGARDLQVQQPQSVADQSMQLMLRQSSTG